MPDNDHTANPSPLQALFRDLGNPVPENQLRTPPLSGPLKYPQYARDEYGNIRRDQRGAPLPYVGIGDAFYQLFHMLILAITGDQEYELFSNVYGFSDSGLFPEFFGPAVEQARETYRRGEVPAGEAASGVMREFFPQYRELLDNLDLSAFNFRAGSPQEEVMRAIADIAANPARNVPAGLMIAIWGAESRFGNFNKSPTGPEGPFQFTQSTMKGIINSYGNAIAAELEANGHREDGQLIRDYMRGGVTDAEADFLRNDPGISAYAASYLLEEIANGMDKIIANGMDKIEVDDTNDWGWIYMGYNISPQNMQALIGVYQTNPNARAYDFLPRKDFADNNSSFFNKSGRTGPEMDATVEEVIRNYNNYLLNHLGAFQTSFAPKTPTAEDRRNASLRDTHREAVSPERENPDANGKTAAPEEAFAHNARDFENKASSGSSGSGVSPEPDAPAPA